MSPGRFITFEGGEGTGKSTQARRLAAALAAAGVPVVTTREPGGSAAAELIRDMLLGHAGIGFSPLTEALLHFAARHDHLEATIRPALANGRWVVCDRFADSTRAYQGYGLGLDPDVVESLYRLAVGTFAPDLTLVIDLPAEKGVRRATERSGQGDRYQQRDLDFHTRVRDGFLVIAAADPHRCVVIDGMGDEAAVAERVRRAVTDRLAVHLPSSTR